MFQTTGLQEGNVLDTMSAYERTGGLTGRKRRMIAMLKEGTELYEFGCDAQAGGLRTWLVAVDLRVTSKSTQKRKGL